MQNAPGAKFDRLLGQKHEVCVSEVATCPPMTWLDVPSTRERAADSHRINSGTQSAAWRGLRSWLHQDGEPLSATRHRYGFWLGMSFLVVFLVLASLLRAYHGLGLALYFGDISRGWAWPQCCCLVLYLVTCLFGDDLPLYSVCVPVTI